MPRRYRRWPMWALNLYPELEDTPVPRSLKPRARTELWEGRQIILDAQLFIWDGKKWDELLARPLETPREYEGFP